MSYENRYETCTNILKTLRDSNSKEEIRLKERIEFLVENGAPAITTVKLRMRYHSHRHAVDALSRSITEVRQYCDWMELNGGD